MIIRRSAAAAASLLLLLLACCASEANAAGPLASVVDQRLVVHHVDGPWARGDFALFEIELNDTVRFSGGALSGWQTLSELNGTLATPPANSHASTSYVPLFLRVAGAVLVNCTKPDGTAVVYTSDATVDANGMPIGAVVVPSTRAPLFSGMAAYGALPVNTTRFWRTSRENVVAIALFLSGDVFRDLNGNGVYTPVPFSNQNATLTAFRTWQCRATLGVQDAGANPATIAVRVGGGNSVPLADSTSDVFVETAPQCDEGGIVEMWDVLNDAMHSVSTLRREHVRPFQILMNSVSLFEWLPGCALLAESAIAERANHTLAHLAAVNADVEWHEGYCAFARGTPEYSTSPCCNRMLASTMCCDPPANTTSSRAVISAYTGNTWGAYSSVSPGLIKSLLADYNAELHRRRMPVWAFDTAWPAWTDIESKCWTRIQTQTCQIDTDCQYSSFCETAVNGVGSGLCHVNWDAVELPLARCYLDLASPLIRAHLLVNLNVTADSATLVQDVATALKRVATQVDCIGPSASGYRKNSTVTYDTNGIAQIVPYDGDQAGCVAAYQCNWNTALDFASCMDTARNGNNLCGVPRGNGLYVNRRVRARCVAPELTDTNTPGGLADTACGQIGGTMVFLDGNTAVRQCVWVNVTTSAACLARSGGAGGGGVSPFCASYATDIQARAALVPSANGNAFSKPYPSYSTLFSMCTNPTGHQLSGGGSSSTGPFCYSAPGAMTRANCTALSNIAHLNSDASLYGAMQNQTYWVDSESTCVSFVAGAAGPQMVPPTFSVSYADLNATFCGAYSAYSGFGAAMQQFHRPVRWQAGEYDTRATCEEGLCQTPGLALSGVTRATCAAAATQCTTRCSGCRSALATTGGFLSETLRRREDGTAGLCVLADAACSNTLYFAYNGAGTNRTFGSTTKCVAEVDPWKCAAMSGSYVSCADLTSLTTCPVAGITAPSTVADYMHQYLKCQWSDSVPCVGAAACLAGGGACNDQITTDCACTTASGCACTNGTCVQVHDLYAPTDRPRCPTWHPEIIDTASGCRNLSALTASSCVSNGGGWTWMPRGGQNAAVCESNAAVCPSTTVPSLSNAFSRRGTADCTACGGTSTSLYTYTAPATTTGSSVDMVWVPRNWTTVNQWKSGISRTLLRGMLDMGARGMIALRSYEYAMDQFHTLSVIFLALAPALKDSLVPLDIAGTMLRQVSAGCVFPPSATSQVCDMSTVAFTVEAREQTDRIAAYTMPPGVVAFNTNATVALARSSFSDAILAVIGLTNTTGGSELPGPSPYSVVVDPDHAHAIGQVVGSFVRFSLLGQSVEQVTVCVPVSADIAIDSGFTVPDFGTSSGSGTATDPFWIVPVGLTDATANDARVCGTIPLSTACWSGNVCTVVPIYRQVDTGEQSSSTSVWLYVGIGLAALAAVGIAIGTIRLCGGAKTAHTPLPQES